MFSQLRNIALAVGLALAVGFSTGFYTKGRFVQASQLEAAIDAQGQTATEIAESTQASVVLEDSIAVSNKRIATIRKKVAQTQKEANEANLKTPGAPACVVDGASVRLLNAARESQPDDRAAGSSDAEGQIPAPVAVSALIDNDLEVVGLYHELAKRHDTLVEYVEKLIAEQAGK